MRTRRNLTVALTALLALLALAAAALASEKATTVRAGNLILTINGGVTPKALPKKTLAPITLNVEGAIATADGSQPPALKEAIVDTDKNGTVNPKGLAVCRKGALLSRDTKSAEEACPDAIIGTGTTDVKIQFPEQAPIPAHSKLLAFNGGAAGGTTTIYIHAYLTQPTPAAIVTTVKISKEHKGRYGLRSIASVPLIVNGNGSVTHFKLTFHRIFTYKGKKQSYFLAKCADGKFLAQTEAVFRDGSKLKGTIVRTCTPKG